ncbi:MAG: hypothetical protein WC444_06100 [Candidatus Paceibacterota bacterium]
METLIKEQEPIKEPMTTPLIEPLTTQIQHSTNWIETYDKKGEFNGYYRLGLNDSLKILPLLLRPNQLVYQILHITPTTVKTLKQFHSTQKEDAIDYLKRKKKDLNRNPLEPRPPSRIYNLKPYTSKADRRYPICSYKPL